VTDLAQFREMTEQTIRNYTDSSSFSNGKSYARDGYIYDTVRRANTLQARSRGRSGGPYKVEATLALAKAPGTEPITSYDCSCPRGGFCKHVVALLLVWLRDPEKFVVAGDPAALLQDLTRDELAAILTALLQQYPDLERRVERLLPAIRPTEGGTAKATLDPDAIRKQVAALVSNRYDQWNDWEDEEESDEELEELLELAERYADNGQWANAYVIYSTLVKETLQAMEQYSDDESNLPEFIEAGSEGLLQVLAAQAEASPADRLPATTRAALIKLLYDAWKYDTNFGYGWSGDVPPALAAAVTPGERAQLEAWVRTDMRHDQWGSKAFVRFILTLKEGAGLSDDAILEEYRKAELYDELTIKLIELGRVEEALKVASDFLPQAAQAIHFAERLLGLGKQWVDPALTCIEARMAKVEEEQRQAAKGKTPQRTPADYQREQNHATYLQWLERQYGQHQRPGKALEIAQRRFELDPGERAYESIKQAAQLPGQPPGLWDDTRPLLLADLEAQDLWAALVNIYLRENAPEEARAALAALDRHLAEHKPTLWSSPDYVSPMALANLQLRVAKATEKDHPDEARAVYQRLAETLIGQRGRANYQQAAEYLAQVRTLYTRAGRKDEWLTYIADLRKRNKALSALRQELDAKKLE
jgi:uncharacterized Zn finger protein